MKQGFDRLSQWANGSAQAPWILSLWSISEAIIWFILSDYLLLILATLAPARSKQWLSYALLGSTVGLVFMFFLCILQPSLVENWLFQLPFTHTGMVDRVVNMASENGLSSVLMQPFSGIPAKVWVYSETVHSLWQPAAFLAVLTMARAIRMSLVLLGGVWLKKLFPDFIRNNWLTLWAVYTALFLYGLWISSSV